MHYQDRDPPREDMGPMFTRTEKVVAITFHVICALLVLLVCP